MLCIPDLMNDSQKVAYGFDPNFVDSLFVFGQKKNEEENVGLLKLSVIYRMRD